MHAAPLFIAETSPDNLRGKLVSYKEAAIVGGIVIGYGAGNLITLISAHCIYHTLLPYIIMYVSTLFSSYLSQSGSIVTLIGYICVYMHPH